MTRWSYESDRGSSSRGTNAVPSHTGAVLDRTTPRIATSGAFTMGVKAVPPMPPRLVIVKHAPCISSRPSLPSLALAETALSSRLSSLTPLRSTSLITGTTRPSAVSTATPMW